MDEECKILDFQKPGAFALFNEQGRGSCCRIRSCRIVVLHSCTDLLGIGIVGA